MNLHLVIGDAYDKDTKAHNVYIYGAFPSLAKAIKIKKDLEDAEDANSEILEGFSIETIKMGEPAEVYYYTVNKV